jgi:hypothetical protein
MRLSTQLRDWLGVNSRPQPTMSVQTQAEQEKQADPQDAILNRIWLIHAKLDAVYGKGFSHSNPVIVAQFMQATATQATAAELAALREIIASGSGGITVGIEKA